MANVVSFLLDKTEKDNKDLKGMNNERASANSSPALSTKSSDSDTKEKKAPVSVPASPAANSVRSKCREMIVNSLKVQQEFEAGEDICC